VGCNYPSKAFGLTGAVNDAFLIAECLQQRCGFEPDNVCVLHDVIPGQKKSSKVEPSKVPTRVNILQRLQHLVRSARPGDILFFSFSGYGLQVDDTEGYQDEGYDEAILPSDFVDGVDGDYAVIVTNDIHDILMGIPRSCAATVLMDCDHATSVIDVSGTLDGKTVGGIKASTFCGLQVSATKVNQASHNRSVWQDERARALKARPRFQPVAEIENPRKGRLPTRSAMSRSTPVAFCYSAARHGQTAMEMQLVSTLAGNHGTRQHGLLTWCFVQAIERLGSACTHVELLSYIERSLRKFKEKDIPRMDQQVLLTFSTPLSDPTTMGVLEPLESACQPAGLASSRRSFSSGLSSGFGSGVSLGSGFLEMGGLAPPVVLLPPRGPTDIPTVAGDWDIPDFGGPPGETGRSTPRQSPWSPWPDDADILSRELVGDLSNFSPSAVGRSCSADTGGSPCHSLPSKEMMWRECTPRGLGSGPPGPLNTHLAPMAGSSSPTPPSRSHLRAL